MKGVKLVNPGNKIIPVSELEEGQIAIIRKWLFPSYEGTLVQRWHDDLVELGDANGWTGLFDGKAVSPSNLVEILNPGTLIEIL